jgi:hypothetical protein
MIRLCTFLSLAAAALLYHPACGQVISPANQRGELLEGMEQVLSNTERESLDVAGLVSPFHPKLEAPVAAIASEAPEPEVREAVTTEPRILPDAVALEMVAERFQPLGSLVLGNRGVLQLSNSRTIAKGEGFRAEIQGVAYEFFIDEVTSDGYRLRLGNATLDRTFLKPARQPGG